MTTEELVEWESHHMDAADKPILDDDYGNPEYETCEECGHTFLWDRLDYENILTSTEHEEFWGAPCSYDIVVGYICPECGHRNSF